MCWRVSLAEAMTVLLPLMIDRPRQMHPPQRKSDERTQDIDTDDSLYLLEAFLSIASRVFCLFFFFGVIYTVCLFELCIGGPFHLCLDLLYFAGPVVYENDF